MSPDRSLKLASRGAPVDVPVVDAPANARWDVAATVSGFAQSPPNATLIRISAAEWERNGGRAPALDLGCGAGRNAIPLARQGWNVVGVDLSWPMLTTAVGRARTEGLSERVCVLQAGMDRLPVQDRSAGFLVAHGIWNLAPCSAIFRRAIGEAARVARPGAALFVFTFSRATLPAEAAPIAGERFVFTQFSGQPQCFLTGDELVSELAAVGFTPDAALPLHELNRPRPGMLMATTAPVIFEGLFRFRD